MNGSSALKTLLAEVSNQSQYLSDIYGSTELSEMKSGMEGVLITALPQMADHQMNMIQQGLSSENNDFMREPTEAEKANMLAQTGASA